MVDRGSLSSNSSRQLRLLTQMFELVLSFLIHSVQHEIVPQYGRAIQSNV